MKSVLKNIAIIVVSYLIGCGIGLAAVKTINHYAKKTAHYQQNRILQLEGNNIGCTGTEVVAPSGKVVTLTAAHCQKQIADNHIGFIDESLSRGSLSVVAIDERLDLMLLEGTNKQLGFEVARKLAINDPIHTMTHGWSMPAYRTDGMVIGVNLEVDPPVCKSSVDIAGFKLGLNCSVPPKRTVTTAWVLPGSSGGPLLNEDGDLIGIVYALTGPFSYSVGLDDIKDFLKGH